MGSTTRTFKISTTISAAPGYFHMRQIAATLDAIRGQAIEAAQDKTAP